VLRDARGRPVPPIAATLHRVHQVDLTGLDPRWSAVDVELASDVTSPLLGPSGATAVFGPQKGLRPGQEVLLEAGLARLATALDRAGPDPSGATSSRIPLAERPGSGAAGGLGAALLALGARLRPGVEVVATAIGLAELLRGADLVLTGEGRIDAQTAAGKVPAGVAALAGAAGVPVLAFAGSLGPGAADLLQRGIGRLVEITAPGTELSVALQDGPVNLRRAVADALRALP
jgi:glycerate kinase